MAADGRIFEAAKIQYVEEQPSAPLVSPRAILRELMERELAALRQKIMRKIINLEVDGHSRLVEIVRVDSLTDVIVGWPDRKAKSGKRSLHLHPQVLVEANPDLEECFPPQSLTGTFPASRRNRP